VVQDVHKGGRPHAQDDRGYESIFRCHIKPRLGNKPLVSMRPIDVDRVIGDLNGRVSRSRVRQVHHLLGMIFAAAVRTA
jgi:hypothetical protein